MKIIFLIITMASTLILTSQSDLMRTIEVTGEYKEEFQPDEITFTISIEEYWEEEFQKGKEYEDYRTKVDITTIEEALIKELIAAGVTMEMVTLKQAGNYRRNRGKDFLINKSLDIRLKSFATANKLSNVLSTRGISSMSVTHLKLYNETEEELNAKTQALIVAKEKAVKIAAAVNKKIKDVVTIIEVDQYVGVSPRPYAKQGMAMLRSAESGGGANYENFKKIEINAVVRVVWELE